MRVGFDARWYNDSGVGTYVAELLKALVPLQLPIGFELLVYEDPKNPVPGLPKPTARIPVSAGKYSLGAQFEFRQRCRQDRLDVFHSPFYPIPLFAGCPIVVTIHDLIPFLFPGEKVFKRLAIRQGYRIAAKRSREIIAVSSHTADDIKKNLRVPEEKISVVYNAVAQLEFHPQAGATEIEHLAHKHGLRPPYVVAASAKNWHTKNLVTALKALSVARRDSNVDFQTVIFGPPDGFNAAGGTEAWKDLRPVPTGHLPAADLARIFRHAQLFLMPSLYEGFGLPLLEAMSCGCAVITSNAASLPKVAGAGAQQFDALDFQSMARATASLLCNPAELELWRQRALRRAMDFSWSKAAQETISVYYRALGDRQNLSGAHEHEVGR